MAITRAQQARQMYKTAGAVEQDGSLNFIKDSESVTVPKEFKARKNAPATKLAYITAEEAKMLKKIKKGTPHKGPKGIPSYDSFGSIDASGKDTGVAGSQVSAAERGDFTGFQGTGGGPKLPPGVKKKPSKEAQDLRSAFIAAGGGQRVNPGFFDSRNIVSPQELRLAKQFAPKAFRKTRGGGLMNFITGGGILGNLVRGLGQKFGLGKRFNEPTYDMSQFSDIGLLTNRVTPNNFDIYNEFVDEDDDNIPITIDDNRSLIPRKNLNDYEGVTPFQEDVIEAKQDQDFTNFENATFAKLNKPGLIQLRNYEKKKGMAPLDPNIDFTNEDQKVLDELLRRQADPDTTYGPVIKVADGGRIGLMEGGMPYEGGIMDLESARQMYGLGKLVKKITRGVKKIAKSPIGKAALLYAGTAGLGALGAGKLGTGFKFFGPQSFLAPSNVMSNLGVFGTKLFANPTIAQMKTKGLEKGFFPSLLDKIPGGGVTAAIAGTSVLAGLLTPEQEDQAQLLADNTGIDIEEARNQILKAAAGQDDFRARAFKADGGIMRADYQEGSKEPVAKKTMPLLDMGGKEMDLRAEGGFVPIGRMEKADDVPARLSKNEFVFTADAVRNAGDGDVDKGAEVMYNMMKNLESGGDVSEESQGLEGARKMFQTSQRLEEVL